jgi:CDGSH-type Zn-finger protein
MPEVTIKTRENGPILITGPVTLVDHLGNPFDLTGKENVALCRCTHSARKPFCDGSHKTCGFVAGETAPLPQ